MVISANFSLYAHPETFRLSYVWFLFFLFQQLIALPPEVSQSSLVLGFFNTWPADTMLRRSDSCNCKCGGARGSWTIFKSKASWCWPPASDLCCCHGVACVEQHLMAICVQTQCLLSELLPQICRILQRTHKYQLHLAHVLVEHTILIVCYYSPSSCCRIWNSSWIFLHTQFMWNYCHISFSTDLRFTTLTLSLPLSSLHRPPSLPLPRPFPLWSYPTPSPSLIASDLRQRGLFQSALLPHRLLQRSPLLFCPQII